MKTNEELKSTPNLLIIRTGVDGGIGEMYRCGKRFGSVIWSNGCGWEHVSVHPYKNRYTPSWEDMCALKDMFFYDDEVVVEYHPAKSEYVNNLSNCLHLWRPTDAVMPTPPSIMVGVKAGQSNEDVKKEISDLEIKAELNNAIEKLKLQYPVAWALHQVWKEVDKNE